MFRIASVLAFFIAVTALVVSPAYAFDADMLRIHATGTWYYGKSDGNTYLADEDGDYENAEFSIALHASVSDKITIGLQPFWEISDEGVETEFDQGYGEYAFSDAFRLRVGIDRHPFGVYTPIYDAGTLRPFMLLPEGLYGEGAGIVAESYAGVGFTGFLGTGNWSVSYDVYGGGTEVSSNQPWEAFGEEAREMEEMEGAEGGEEGEEGEEAIELEDLIGGRVVVHTPVAGLNVGGSVYTGTITGEAEGGALEDHNSTAWGVQAEYLADRISLRTEFARQDTEGEFETDAFYAEGAYMITANLQAAVRYDWSDTSLKEREAEELEGAEVGDFLEHEEWAFGLNWWFSPNFVIKFSYHLADGFRFAAPEDDDSDRETKTFLAGAAFAF